ncbi:MULTISPECIES: arsenate reductase family protein [Dysgonomonas]|uniref:arsenate reductase family protein n=1 Tax=Dysgonomonas TaxID=156973 RepID=UPI000927271D|nr:MULTISPECIES: arsenate reductase family protein [Dysgonomonas]MBN9303137.1 arsenate reductase family protein [Dysgonomonas mossii]OJX65449.1 MAG: ArsC family transcriptional regulator [Dysgonomonas sp. 37-18]
MTTTLFLQYPKCSTCQKAAKWLKENNVEVNSRDITKENPSKAELSEWIKKSGLPISRFFNTSGRIYKENNLKDKVKSASQEELLDILSSDGMVVKRPIVVGKDFVLVGFNEEEWIQKLK